MSGGGVKHFFEQPAAEDSRVFAQLGRTLHIPALTEEAKHNEQNPGRAITKAGINAALWYLGGEAGGLLGGAGDTAGAVAGEAGDESAGLAMNAVANGAGPYGEAAAQAAGTGGLLAGGGSQMTAEQLQQLAMQNMSNTGMGAGSGSISPTNMLQLSQPAPVSDLSVQATAQPLRAAQDYAARLYGGARNMASDTYNGARGLLGQSSSVPAEQAGAPVRDASVAALRSGRTSSNLATQMGLKMLQPQQRQPMPMAPPPQQGQQGPLSNPYQQNPYGPGGNSMGLTEEQKQKLRAMGYQIP